MSEDLSKNGKGKKGKARGKEGSVPEFPDPEREGGSQGESTNLPPTPNGKPGLTDIKKLLLTGAIFGVIGIASAALLKRVIKDNE